MKSHTRGKNSHARQKQLIMKTNICSINGVQSISDISSYEKNDSEAGLKSYHTILEKGGGKILKSNLT
mgnify:CR=1 FL=1